MAEIAVRVQLPCGCALIASHTSGERLRRCQGSDGNPAALPTIRRNGPPACPGGRTWALRAREVVRVEYDVRPVDVPGGAA